MCTFSLLRIINSIVSGLVDKVMRLLFVQDNIFIRFGTKLYQQPIGVLMSTNCDTLLKICFCFVMKEILCHPFLTKIKPVSIFS